LQRFQRDIKHIRQLQHQAGRLDEIFYHRIKRKVKKDATLAYEGKLYEVPYELIGQTLMLVFDPHRQQPLYIESEAGDYLGAVTALDLHANYQRKRVRTPPGDNDTTAPPPANNLVEQALQRQTQALSPDQPKPKEKKPCTNNTSD